MPRASPTNGLPMFSKQKRIHWRPPSCRKWVTSCVSFATAPSCRLRPEMPGAAFSPPPDTASATAPRGSGEDVVTAEILRKAVVEAQGVAPPPLDLPLFHEKLRRVRRVAREVHLPGGILVPVPRVIIPVPAPAGVEQHHGSVR